MTKRQRKELLNLWREIITDLDRREIMSRFDDIDLPVSDDRPYRPVHIDGKTIDKLHTDAEGETNWYPEQRPWTIGSLPPKPRSAREELP